MSCTIPNSNIRNIAKRQGKNAEEINAICDVINDLFDNNIDIATAVSENELEMLTNSVSKIFEGKSSKESSAIKESISNTIKANPHMNPLTFLSSIAVEKAKRDYNAANNEYKYQKSHDHIIVNGRSNAYERREDIDTFIRSFMDGRESANLIDFLDRIVDYDERSSKFARSIIPLLEKVYKDQPLTITFKSAFNDLRFAQNQRRSAYFNYTTGIVINRNAGFTSGVDYDQFRYNKLVQTIFHECLHALTKNLMLGDANMREKGEELLANIKAAAIEAGVDVDKYYGLTDVEEMMSEVFNGEFAKMLDTLEVKDRKNTGLLGKIRNLVKNFIESIWRRWTGKTKRTALDDVKDYILSLIGDKSPLQIKEEPKALVKFYAPTMGKTYVAQRNNKFVDFDDIVRADIKELAKKEGKTVRQIKTESGSAYRQLLLDTVNKWKQNVSNKGKTLLISNAVLARENIFDNQVSIPDKETFVKRQVERSEEDKPKSILKKEAEEYYDDLINKWYDHPIIDNRFVEEIESGDTKYQLMKDDDIQSAVKNYRDMSTLQKGTGESAFKTPAQLDETFENLIGSVIQEDTNTKEQAIKAAHNIIFEENKDQLAEMGITTLDELMSERANKDSAYNKTKFMNSMMLRRYMNTLLVHRRVARLFLTELKKQTKGNDITLNDIHAVFDKINKIDSEGKLFDTFVGDKIPEISGIKAVKKINGVESDVTIQDLESRKYNGEAGYIKIKDGNVSYYIFKNNEGYNPNVMKVHADGEISRIVYTDKSTYNGYSEDTAKTLFTVLVSRANRIIENKDVKAIASQEKLYEKQQSYEYAKSEREGLSKTVFARKNKDGISKTLYVPLTSIGNTLKDSINEKVGGENANSFQVKLNFQNKEMTSLNVGDDVYLEIGNGKLLHLFVEDAKPTQDGKEIEVAGNAVLGRNANYNIESANIFDDLTYTDTSFISNSAKNGDRLEKAKMAVGVQHFEHRRSMLASDFESVVKNEARSQAISSLREEKDRKEERYVEVMGVKSDKKVTYDVHSDNEKRDIQARMDNMKDVDVIQVLGIQHIFDLVKDKYRKKIEDLNESKKKATMSFQLSSINYQIDAYTKLLEDDVFETMAIDSLDIISENMGIKVSGNKASNQSEEDARNSKYGEESEEYDITSLEETYVEDWAQGDSKNAKHLSITVELRRYLNSIRMYEEGKPKTDDLGYPIYMDGDEVFKVLQTQLEKCKNKDEISERLYEFVQSAPQYQALFDEVTSFSFDENGNKTPKEVKNPTLLSHLFSAMYGNVKNIFVTKKGKISARGEDGKWKQYDNNVSFQINIKNGYEDLVAETISNISNGYVIGENSIYNQDGKINIDVADGVKARIAKMIDTLSNAGGAVNLYKNARVFKARIYRDYDLAAVVSILKGKTKGIKNKKGKMMGDLSSREEVAIIHNYGNFLYDTMRDLGFNVSYENIATMFINNPEFLMESNKKNILGYLMDYLTWDTSELVDKNEDTTSRERQANVSSIEFKKLINNIARLSKIITKPKVDKGQWENGKMVNAHVQPSYESMMVDSLKIENQEEFIKFREEEFGKYDWFKKSNADMIGAMIDEITNSFKSLTNFLEAIKSESDPRVLQYIDSITELRDGIIYQSMTDDSGQLTATDISTIKVSLKDMSTDLKSLAGYLSGDNKKKAEELAAITALGEKIPSLNNEYMNALLTDLENADAREQFQLFTVNHSFTKEYNDWSKIDSTRESITQYYKELYDGVGNEKIQDFQYISIANPTLSDSPVAEYWRLKRRTAKTIRTSDRESGKHDTYANIVFGKNFNELTSLQQNRIACYLEMVRVVKQETNRIGLVIARHQARMEALKKYNADVEKFTKESVRRSSLPVSEQEALQKNDPLKVPQPSDYEGYTEKIPFYDIDVKADGTIKDKGGSEYKFFPGLNEKDESGTSFAERMFNHFTNGDTIDFVKIEEEALKGIIRIQNEEFEKTFKKWNNIGLFNRHYDSDVDDFVFDNFSQQIPFTTKIQELTAENMRLGRVASKENLEKIRENDRLIDELEKSGDRTLSNESKEMLREFIDQSCLATALIEELLITDLAFYKNPNDFQKRYKEVYAPSRRLLTDMPYFGKKTEKCMYFQDQYLSSGEETVEVIGKILSGAGIKGPQLDDILNTFRGNNLADAQAFRSSSSYRSVKAMSGDLKLEEKVVLSRLIGDLDKVWKLAMTDEERKEAIAEGFVTQEDADNNIFTYADIRKHYGDEGLKHRILEDSLCVFQTIKPFLYGQIGTPNGFGGLIKMGVQQKNSEFCLLWATEIGKRYADVLSLSDKDRVSLNKIIGLAEFMEENGIDVAMFNSAVKVGGQGAINLNKWNSTNVTFKEYLESQALNIKEDGNKSFREGVIHTVPYKYYGIQTSTPEHLIDIDQLVGSQIRRLILADNNANDDQPFIVNGKKYTRKQLVSYYNALITENVLESMRELDKMFADPREVEKLLMREMQGNDQYTPDMIRACKLREVDGRLQFDLLSDPVISKKIESLFNSIIRSRVTKQKIKGGACIQVACFGYEGLEVKWATDENGKKTHPISMEVLLGAYSRDFIKPAVDPNTGVLDLRVLKENVDEETYNAIITAIGYRVPTEDKYSMAKIIVKGFLPPMNGSAIMLPKEITTLSGSDFDVDKMYLMLHEFDKVMKFKFKDNTTATTIVNFIASKLEGNSELANKAFGKKTEDKVGLIRELADLYVSYESDVSDKTKTSFRDYAKKKDKDYIKMERAFNKFIKKAYEDRSKYSIYDDFFNELYNVSKDFALIETVQVKKFEGEETEKKTNIDYGNEAALMSREERNNAMIDCMAAVMSHPDTASKFLKPGGFDAQKKTARIIELLTNISGNSIEEKLDVLSKKMGRTITKDNIMREFDVMSLDEVNDLASKYKEKINPLSPWSQVYFHDQNKVGKQLIGVYANHNAGHAAAQFYNLNLSKSFAFKFCGQVRTSLCDTDPRISNTNAGFLAASVDNVKDPVLYWLNQSLYTADSSMLLTRLGYTANQVGLFMSQPIIKKAVELFNNGVTGSKEDLFKEAIKQYFKTDDDDFIKASNNSNITENSLCMELLSPTEEGQKEIASLFMHMLGIAQELSSFTQNTKSDTQNGAAKSTIAGNIIKNRRINDMIKNAASPVVEQALLYDESLFNRTSEEPVSFYNFDGKSVKFNNDYYQSEREKLYNSPYPMLTAFDYAGLHSIERYLGKYFKWYGPTIKTMIDKFEAIKGDNLTEDELTDIFEDFIAFRMSTVPIFGNIKDDFDSSVFTTQDKREIYLKKFIDSFYKLKSENQDIANNALIKSIDTKWVNVKTNKVATREDYEKASDKSDYVRLLVLKDVGQLSKTEKQKLTSAWEDLYYNGSEKGKKLALDLICYSYFRNGMNFSPDSFGSLAPLFRAELPGYKDIISRLDCVTDRTIDNFITQYIRNHPSSSIVPRVWQNAAIEVIDTSERLILTTFSRGREAFDKLSRMYIKNIEGERVLSSYPQVIILPVNASTNVLKALCFRIPDGKQGDKIIYKYKVKPFIKIGNNLYKANNSMGGIFYTKMSTLGLANESDGSQFLEYSQDEEGFNSIFEHNNESYGKNAFSLELDRKVITTMTEKTIDANQFVANNRKTSIDSSEITPITKIDLQLTNELYNFVRQRGYELNKAYTEQNRTQNISNSRVEFGSKKFGYINKLKGNIEEVDAALSEALTDASDEIEGICK